MNFTIFNKTTGQIIQSGSCPDEYYDLQIVHEDCKIVPIKSNPFEQYFDNDVLINIPKQIEQDSFFDFKSKKWIVNVEQKIANILSFRKTLLQESDWTQIPNNPLTIEQQQEWENYRQQLRDITSQSGYPFNVIWPTPPQG